MFHHGNILDHLPKWKSKYNKIENIMNYVQRVSDRDGGLDRERLKKNCVFVGRFGSNLIHRRNRSE